MKKLYTLLVVTFIVFTANAQIVNIPDANFKAKLLLASPSNTIAANALNVSIKIDANNNNEIEVSEALQVARLNVYSSGISSLTGLASFTNLHLLNCSDNQITSLDLTGLNSLVNLVCAYNQIPELNFGAINLQELQCHYNLLTDLDVSNMSNLYILFCGNNQLSSLNISGSINLIELDAGTNLLTTIDLNGLPTLEDINLDANLLTSIDLSSLPNVVNVDIVGNHLTEILCKNGHNENLFFISNPDLYHICGDDSQISSLQNQVASYGYTNCTVDSACLLSNESFNIETSFTVSPNPAKELLNLETKTTIEVKSINIYNLLGQIVIAIPNAESVSTIDVSNLKTGTYFIKLITDKGTANTKFIKN